MAEMTGEEYFPHDTYHGAWTVFWIGTILGGIWLWLTFFRPLPVTEPPRAAISAGYDWFLVLHLPEMPKDPVRAAAMQKTFSGWFDALARDGYHPMLLSDVEDRLKEGVGLPDRAVVLTFDPAYYNTYKEVSPLLIQYRFPALWVTDHTNMLRGDRHFLNRRQAKWIIHSGFWDLAYTGDGFWRKATDSNQMVINESRNAEWVDGTGRTALNWSTDFPHLNRLDVSTKWTPEELLLRLEMEIPLEGTVHLSVRRLANRLWGIVATTVQKDGVFSFQAPLSATSSTLYWLGTRGARDVRLSVTIPSFFGEVSLWLRSDVKEHQGIAVGFTKTEIFVDQEIEGDRKRLTVVRWAPPSGSIHGQLTLEGSQLRIAVDGLRPFMVPLTPFTPSRNAMVRMQVFDRVRGAARADFVGLVLTALKKPAHQPQ